MGSLGARRCLGGAGWPHLAVAWPLLRCGVLSSVLKPFGVDFAVDKRDFI